MKEIDDDEEEKKPDAIEIEEGASHLITSIETVYSLLVNTENKNNKIFISINYPEKTIETEFASLYTDSDCKNLFQELKPSKGFNNFYNFDISKNQPLFMKSNNPNPIYFYYKYCTEKDLEQIKDLKKSQKVKCLENKDNKLKISFDSLFSKEVKFNTKYTIYVSEGKKKKYDIFKDQKIDNAKIVEGNKDKYETEVKIDSSKKEQFVYVVAEPKDPNVNLRPKIIFKGDKVPEAENKFDTIINIILIILIILTLIYKVMKRRRLAQQRKEVNPPINITFKDAFNNTINQTVNATINDL